MNLEPIAMDRDTAAAAVRAYRIAIRNKTAGRAALVDRDRQLLRGYRALARGRRLIDLTQAFTAAGTFEPDERTRDRLPKLAICEADAVRCVYSTRHRIFCADRAMDIRGGGVIGRGWVRDPLTYTASSWRSYEAVVPSVPAALRPANGLAGYHVLWEVDSWAAIDPPRDPALLKWIGGGLWAVLAVWDLTELERAVLKGSTR